VPNLGFVLRLTPQYVGVDSDPKALRKRSQALKETS
jgi:hypothetical protein